jgi:uncharacterized membrane protein YbhN (UPF0104 family)
MKGTLPVHSFLRTLGRYVFLLAFVLLCVWYVVAHRADFAFIAAVSVPDLAAAGVFVLTTYLIIAYQYHLFLRHFGLTLGFVELIAMTAGMLLGNLVLPMRGGSGGLAVYLKRVHALDFQAFGAIYGGTALLAALVNTGLALLGLLVLWWLHGFVHVPLAGLVLAVFGACIYLCLFPPKLGPGRGLVGTVLEVTRSWHALTQNRRLLAALSFSFLVLALDLCLAFYFIYRAMGMRLSLSAVLITSSLGGIANLIPITPGSLGIFDAVVIQVPQLFGVDPARSIAGALVFRAMSFAWGFLMGLPGLLYLFRTNTAKGQDPAADSS